MMGLARLFPTVFKILMLYLICFGTSSITLSSHLEHYSPEADMQLPDMIFLKLQGSMADPRTISCVSLMSKTQRHCNLLVYERDLRTSRLSTLLTQVRLSSIPVVMHGSSTYSDWQMPDQL